MLVQVKSVKVPEDILERFLLYQARYNVNFNGYVLKLLRDNLPARDELVKRRKHVPS